MDGMPTVTMNRILSLLIFALTASTCSGFTVTVHKNAQFRPYRTRLYQVYEDDVLKAVEKAEDLWAEALEARKTANALSDKAQEEAEAASATAQDVDAMMSEGKISVEKLAAADRAAQSNVVAGGFVTKALEANDEAERLEGLAEEALAASEAALEQHIQDFPDSPLAADEEQ